MRAHLFIFAVSIAIALGGSAKAEPGGLMQLRAYGAGGKAEDNSAEATIPNAPTHPNYNIPRVNNGMGGKAFSN